MRSRWTGARASGAAVGSTSTAWSIPAKDRNFFATSSKRKFISRRPILSGNGKWEICGTDGDTGEKRRRHHPTFLMLSGGLTARRNQRSPRHVVSLNDLKYLKAWLADHPADAPTLLELLEINDALP